MCHYIASTSRLRYRNCTRHPIFSLFGPAVVRTRILAIETHDIASCAPLHSEKSENIFEKRLPKTHRLQQHEVYEPCAYAYMELSVKGFVCRYPLNIHIIRVLARSVQLTGCPLPSSSRAEDP